MPTEASPVKDEKLASPQSNTEAVPKTEPSPEKRKLDTAWVTTELDLDVNLKRTLDEDPEGLTNYELKDPLFKTPDEYKFMVMPGELLIICLVLIIFYM